MATEGPLLHDGSQTTAGADLSSSQFLGVKLSTSADRTVILVAASTDIPYGVVQNKPTSGQAADVGIVGVTKVKAGGTVTRGDSLMFNGSGLAVTATGSNVVWGYALESAVNNQIMTARITGAPVILTSV